MSQDTFSPSGEQTGGNAAVERVSIDRLELNQQFAQQREEKQVEEALNLYAKAARAWMHSDAPEVPDSADSEEEREARSQELKLRQKCQDIAARIMVDELEDELEDEE